MNSEQIIKEICKILENKLNIDPNQLTYKYYSTPLTGEKYKLNSTRLTYLFLEVEKRFNIKIDTNKILSYEFNTIKGIAELVQSTQT